ncbi:hypothetical protein TUMEXPCC7403_19645 [Tumidithrix helvetica PCC 7403]
MDTKLEDSLTFVKGILQISTYRAIAPQFVK